MGQVVKSLVVDANGASNTYIDGAPGPGNQWGVTGAIGSVGAFGAVLTGPVSLGLTSDLAAAGLSGGNVLTRALTASDLGLSADSLTTLNGTYSVNSGIANIYVKMLQGNIAQPFSVMSSLAATPAGDGASILNITGTVANPVLYSILASRAVWHDYSGCDRCSFDIFRNRIVIDVKSRASRILYRIPRFTLAADLEEQKLHSQFEFPVSEELLGVYVNNACDHHQNLFFTTEAIYSFGEQSWLRYPYFGIVKAILPGAKADLVGVEIQLQNGKIVLLPISTRTDNKFYDAFEILRFLTRVRDDIAKKSGPNEIPADAGE